MKREGGAGERKREGEMMVVEVRERRGWTYAKVPNINSRLLPWLIKGGTPDFSRAPGLLQGHWLLESS